MGQYPQSDLAFLGVFERKTLLKIFCSVRIGEDYRIRMNHELYELYADIDIVKRITIHRLPWLGHVVRMDESAAAKKVFDDRKIEGQRRNGRPRLVGKTRACRIYTIWAYPTVEGKQITDLPGRDVMAI